MNKFCFIHFVVKSFLHCETWIFSGTGARNENLRPVLKSGLWRGNMVRNLLTSGHRKVVFWLFLNLCTWANSSFTKEERLHQKMYKIKLAHCCDVVPNLVVEIKIFNFGLFVCLLVCLYLAFCQFRKRKMVQLWFQKLFWNQGCDVVSNLVVEIAIYNFDLFHTALLYNVSIRISCRKYDLAKSCFQSWPIIDD